MAAAAAPEEVILQDLQGEHPVEGVRAAGVIVKYGQAL